MPKTRKFYVHGYAVLLDESDWHLVEEYGPWYIFKNGRTHYVCSSHVENGQRTRYRLHRLVAGASEDQVVDHINSSGLDNRRNNLRVGTQFENLQNRRKAKNNKSGFVGVCWSTDAAKWRASLQYNGKHYFLGHYSTKEEAALSYNAGVLRILPPNHSKLRKLNVAGETNETKKVA